MAHFGWAGIVVLCQNIFAVPSPKRSIFFGLHLESVLRAIGVFPSTSWRVQQQPMHLWLPHRCVPENCLTYLYDAPRGPGSTHHHRCTALLGHRLPGQPPSSSKLHQRDLCSPSVLVPCHCSSKRGCNPLTGQRSFLLHLSHGICAHCGSPEQTLQQTVLHTLYTLGACQVWGTLNFHRSQPTKYQPSPKYHGMTLAPNRTLCLY